MMCVVEEELNKYRSLSFSILEWLENMVLNNRIRLQDISQSIRLADCTLYTLALRLSSRRALPCERFISDLNTLCEDILSLDDRVTASTAARPAPLGQSPYDIVSCEIDLLVNRLFDYMSLNQHEDEECFIRFKNNLDERILSLMQHGRCESRI